MPSGHKTLSKVYVCSHTRAAALPANCQPKGQARPARPHSAHAPAPPPSHRRAAGRGRKGQRARVRSRRRATVNRPAAMVVTPLLATAGFQVAKGGESSALGAKDRRSSAAGAAGRGGAGCAEKTGWHSFSGALFGARGQPASGAACALHAVRAAPSVIWGRWGRGIEHPTKTFAPCGPPRGALARQSCVCRTRPAQNEETFWFCRARRRERARRPRRAPARARRLRQGHPHGRKKNGARPSPGARPRPPAFSLPRLHLACVECSSFLHPHWRPSAPPAAPRARLRTPPRRTGCE